MGGFSGGPGQAAHLAPTYAAVNALCIIGTQEAYNVIDREKLLSFLFSVKQPDGSFVMHVGGEVDVSCQNWEGGLGGVPGLEAHGGYTFCGTAAMVILGKDHMLDLKSRDFYHTCYCLSGLSVAQHFGNMDLHHELIVGQEENRLAPSHPVYNICPEKVAQAIRHFHQLPVPVPAQKEGSSGLQR
ncbi:unnamed protein product [Coregonus sp. 'balchen']|nr:unnamed protein product [Coregonus sp. 'balchen']